MIMCNTFNLSFRRQLLVLSAGALTDFSRGCVIAFPGVLGPALTRPDAADLKATAAQADWLTAILGLSGIGGSLITPALTQIYGRRFIHALCSAILMTGWIILYFATSYECLFAARFIQGIEGIGGMIINAVIVAEYVHPTRRGYFMTAKVFICLTGVLTCHSLATVWSWRQISGFVFYPNFFAVALTFFWPESPSFLAMKGRFEECEKSFLWLNGQENTSQNTKELDALIATYTEITNRKQRGNKTNSARKFIKKLLMKNFQKSLFLAVLMTVAIDAMGNFFSISYLIQIMVELAGEESALYCSIGADLLTLLSVVPGVFLVTYYKRRTLLFTSGFFTVFLMFLGSLLIYLKSHHNILADVVWLNPAVIMFQIFVLNLGVVPVYYTAIGEIFPTEHVAAGVCLTSVVTTGIYALDMKLIPIIIKTTGVEGMYAIYGLIVLVCLVILYFTLVETKDRTLLEIGVEMKGDKMQVEMTPIVESLKVMCDKRL